MSEGENEEYTLDEESSDFFDPENSDLEAGVNDLFHHTHEHCNRLDEHDTELHRLNVMLNKLRDIVLKLFQEFEREMEEKLDHHIFETHEHITETFKLLQKLE